MSCVPYEQHAFEFGPRDYLNQLMSLISTLRGGQQRYLPLLLSKINDSMPSMPTPGYSLPVALHNTRVDELYEGSQTHSSAPTSGESSPFGSPPLSAVGPSQVYRFQPTSSGFPPATTTTTGAQYSDLSVSAPMQPFSDPALHGFPGGSEHLKYDIG